jgi:ribonuclease J
MHFKIHRGTKEIGGSCVEVWTDTSRIVIDFGMPLVNSDMSPFDARETEKRSRDELIQDKTLPDIPSLYQGGTNTAVLISHAHQDHYGLMKHINPSCPVYLGFVTQQLIELTNTFTGKKWTIQNAKHIEHDKPFKIGDIQITPYLMDHAAFDAYAFLIEASGKSLFYSGDFRMHGRKEKIFDWFCDNFKKSVDYLLLEGSTIGRTDKRFPTESELENDFVEIFKQTKGINLVFVSGQNIDRLVTIYRACKQCGKIFLIDFYIANVLRTINKKANSKRIPFPSEKDFPEVKVYYPHWLTKRMIEKKAETVYPFKKYKIGLDKLNDKADKLVMMVRPTVQNDLEQRLKKYDDGCFIYSMYEGYKTRPGEIKDFLDFIESKGMPIKDIHTSGHADLFGLKRMVETVKPKHIVPIHTFEGNSYAELFPAVDIRRINDKETIEI